MAVISRPMGDPGKFLGKDVQKLAPNELIEAVCTALPNSMFSDIMLVILGEEEFTPREQANAAYQGSLH